MVQQIIDRFFYFFDIYRDIQVQIKKIPPSSAYEFQHALTHFYYAKFSQSTEIKVRQYKSVIGHLRRGMLDAWKTEIIIRNKTYKKLFSVKETTPEQIKKNLTNLFKARLNEYYDVGHIMGEASDRPLADNFYNSLVCFRAKENTKVVVTESASHDTFFEQYNLWAQYELILSSLVRLKEITHLQTLMNACFRNFDVTILKDDILLLQYDCLRALKIFITDNLEEIFLPWLEQRPDLIKLRDKSRSEVDNNKVAVHGEYLNGLLKFFEIELKPFSKLT